MGTTSGPEAGRPSLTVSDLAHLDFVEHVFLPEAARRQLVGGPQDAALKGLVRQLVAEAGAAAPPTGSTAVAGPASPTGYEWPTGSSPRSVPAPPASAPPASAPAAPAPPASAPPPPTGLSLAELERQVLVPHVPSPAAAPPAQPAPPAPPTPQRPPAPPSPLRQWWSRTVRAVGSDLAVHGLAYLGVLLFFVGAFGLVAFAFADVASGLRPVAEVVIAVAPFAAGALLRRRRADAVGRSLELAGGLVLPIMIVTSVLDGVAFPPDLSGVPLVVTLALLMAGLALGYAAWSRRHPASALRFLVAPAGWLAVGLATMGVGRAIPGGKAVATPSAAQVAAMAVALTATLLGARLRPKARLAGPTTTAALPGLVVLGALGVLTWAAEGWPALPVLLTGTALAAALEVLAPRLPALTVGVVQPAWWVVVWVALSGSARDSLERTAVAALVAAGFLALLELAGSRRRPPAALVLPAVGAVLALGSALSGDLTWAAAVLAGAGVWAIARRTAPYPAPGAAGLLDLAAATLPLAALGALTASGGDAGPGTAAVVGALVLLVIAVPAARGWLDRTAGERYWRGWWAGGVAVVVLLTVSIWERTAGIFEPWSAAVALGLLAVATLVGPLPPAWRPVVASALGVGAWLSAASVASVGEDLRWAVPAVTALALVVLAHVPSAGPVAAQPVRVALGLSGHGLGVLAVAGALGTEWGLVGAVAAATAGWCLTGWRDVRGASPVGAALRAAQPSLAGAPLALGAIGIPATFSLLLDRSGLYPLDSPWSTAVLSALAVVYAAASGLAVPARVARMLARVGVLLAVVAAVFATQRMSAVLALVALMAAVAIVPSDHRIPPMTWFAWVAPAPAAHLLGLERWPWAAGLPGPEWDGVVLVAVGGVILLGGLAARRVSGLPGRRWTTAALTVGGVEVAAGLAIGVVDRVGPVAGWLCAAVAVVVLVAGALSRIGALGGVAALLGWWAALLLAGDVIATRPWLALAAAAGLLALAEALSRVMPTPVETNRPAERLGPGMSTGAGTNGPAERLARLMSTGAGTNGPAERPGQGSMAAAPAGSRPAREPSLPWWGRWDLALLLAAAPVAATGVLLGVGTATEALCWTLAGLECLAVAARLRRHRSAAAALGALGAVLVLLGASIAGSGWLALGLVGLAAVLTVLGALVESPWDLACRAGGALAAVAAGATALDWLAWPAQRSIDTAALVAAAVLAVTAVLARVLPEVDRQWWLVWGGAAAAVEALVAAIVLAPAAPATALGSWAVAAGLTVTAAALALVVSAVNVGWLREGAAAYLLAAIVVGLGSGEASPRAEVIAASGIAAASAVAVLAVTGGAGAPWRRALLVLGVPPTVWALLTAWVSGTGALGVPVALPLAVASLQAAAIGVAWRRVGFQMLSPALACAAWVSMGFDLLGAGPESVTIPAGFAALVAVGLWRHDRVQRSEPVASSEIVVLELSGVVLLVGPALASALAVGPGHALLAIVLGLGVAWWGVVTEVRRRVAAGAGTVLVGALLLVAAPLVALLPAWQGAGMWLLIAVAGLLAVLAAALVERGKSLARSGLARLAEATAGWE